MTSMGQDSVWHDNNETNFNLMSGECNVGVSHHTNMECCEKDLQVASLYDVDGEWCSHFIQAMFITRNSKKQRQAEKKHMFHISTTCKKPTRWFLHYRTKNPHFSKHERFCFGKTSYPCWQVCLSERGHSIIQCVVSFPFYLTLVPANTEAHRSCFMVANFSAFCRCVWNSEALQLKKILLVELSSFTQQCRGSGGMRAQH